MENNDKGKLICAVTILMGKYYVGDSHNHCLLQMEKDTGKGYDANGEFHKLTDKYIEGYFDDAGIFRHRRPGIFQAYPDCFREFNYLKNEVIDIKKGQKFADELNAKHIAPPPQAKFSKFQEMRAMLETESKYEVGKTTYFTIQTTPTEK